MLLVAKFGPKLQLAQDKNKYFIMVATVNLSNDNNLVLKFNEKLEKVRSNTLFSKSKVFNYAWYNEDFRDSHGTQNVNKLGNFLAKNYAKYDYEFVPSDIHRIVSKLMECINAWICKDIVDPICYVGNDKLMELLKNDKYYYDSNDSLYDRELQNHVRYLLKIYSANYDTTKSDICEISLADKIGIRQLTFEHFINNDSELNAGNIKRIAAFLYKQKIIS